MLRPDLIRCRPVRQAIRRTLVSLQTGPSEKLRVFFRGVAVRVRHDLAPSIRREVGLVGAHLLGMPSMG